MADTFNPTYFQTLMKIPERCAFIAGRIVVKRPFLVYGETENEGRVWAGNPTDYLEQGMDFAKPGSYPVRMIIGDVGGTDIGIALTYEADGEAYLTGVLCQPEEVFFRWPQIRTDAPPPVVFGYNPDDSAR